MASAAILVGGRATRYGGVDKSTLIVDGRTILARQLAELTTVTEDILLVGGPPRAPAAATIRWIADRGPGAGPLGGLCTAFESARDDVLVLLASDMPFVTGAFLKYLLDLTYAADVVVPRTGRGYHPLCAAYTRRCQHVVRRRLQEGRLAMMGVLDELRVWPVDPSDLERFGGADRLLANVNTPADFTELEAPFGHKL
jgi:molybdopterin-guanine dinucleotide biosynthesis protein A